MPRRGRFITFEGGEGTGKSTQIALLDQELKAAGLPTLATREPGGTPGGEAVRDLLVTGAPDRWQPQAEALLNYAARQDHLHRVIRPALAQGAWVLCDRFADSTLAYQAYAGGCDPGFVRFLEDAVVGDTQPDVTFVLDLDPEEGLSRATQRRSDAETRFETKGLPFHRDLRQAFLRIAADNPHRCVVVDAAASIDTVAACIRSTVSQRLC